MDEDTKKHDTYCLMKFALYVEYEGPETHKDVPHIFDEWLTKNVPKGFHVYDLVFYDYQ